MPTPPPAAWQRVKLNLRWIVFEDRMGNFIVVNPDRPKPLGAPAAMKRQPTVYLATTEQEIEEALESVLYVYERTARVHGRYLSLVERVREALGRYPHRQKEPKAA